MYNHSQFSERMSSWKEKRKFSVPLFYGYGHTWAPGGFAKLWKNTLVVNYSAASVLAEPTKCETSSLHVQPKVFYSQKRERMSLVKFIRQEKIIKVYTTIVTICWTKELCIKRWKSNTLRFTSSLGCKTSYIVCRNQCKMKMESPC